MKECFLGIDIGTGSSKGVAADVSGTVLARASVPHDVESPFPGAFEQDADGVWWHDFVCITRKLINRFSDKSIRASDIRGVCVSSIAPCVLPVDRLGHPLRKGILYGIDTRASREVSDLENIIGRQAILAMTGQQLSSQSCIPKILWVRNHEPEVWERTAAFLTATGYVVHRLTGVPSVDMYDAIGYAPLFNLVEKRWDSTFEEATCPLSLLPPIIWSDTPCGTVCAQAAEETGIPEGTPVTVGTADAAAESLACGIKDPGDMMMMYGSSNFFIMRTSTLRPSDRFWASHYLEQGSTVITGGMATVGSMFKWFMDTFPGRSFAEWESLASHSQPGAHGVAILPYFAGERTPLLDPRAKGMVFGLSLTTSAGDVYTALQEAVGYGIRHNLETLKKLGEHAGRIIAIGGAAESTQMMQRITDIIGCPQQLPSNRLGACYGDAYLAAVGSGYVDSIDSIDTWVKIDREFIPNPEFQEIYAEGYRTYRQLYESTKHML